MTLVELPGPENALSRTMRRLNRRVKQLGNAGWKPVAAIAPVLEHRDQRHAGDQ